MNNYLRHVIKIFLPDHGIIIQVIRFLFVSVKFLLYTLWLLSIYILYDSYQDTIMKCFEFKVFAWNFLQLPLPKKNNCNSTELQQKNLGWHIPSYVQWPNIQPWKIKARYKTIIRALERYVKCAQWTKMSQKNQNDFLYLLTVTYAQS